MLEFDRGVEAMEAWLWESSLLNIGVTTAGDNGPSKSHGTPCFEQFPQVGWTSSHCARVRMRKPKAMGLYWPWSCGSCTFGNQPLISCEIFWGALCRLERVLRNRASQYIGYTVHRDTKEIVSHIFFEADVQESFRFNEFPLWRRSTGKQNSRLHPSTSHQDNFKVLRDFLNGFF
jgi:hypothetical protein